jgi:hypothetical protein
MASPRAMETTEPVTPATTDHPRAGGRKALPPEVHVNDSVTKPLAAYLAALTTPGNTRSVFPGHHSFSD